MEVRRLLSPDGPAEMTYVARLGHAPHYAGSFHDDAFARKMGYARALVPGAFLFGAMSHLAVRIWGLAWAERGAISASFHRPCFDGDALTVTATPPHEAAEGLSADITITRPDGGQIATGSIALPPAAASPPDPAGFPIGPLPEVAPAMPAGRMPVGAVLGCHDEVLNPAQHQQAPADFGETFAPYHADRIIHAGRPLRAIMRDANRNWRFPTPVILTACSARQFGLAHAGERIATAGTVADAYERRGNHYFETRQLLTADRRPVALFRCTQIYAARQDAA